MGSLAFVESDSVANSFVPSGAARCFALTAACRSVSMATEDSRSRKVVVDSSVRRLAKPVKVHSGDL